MNIRAKGSTPAGASLAEPVLASLAELVLLGELAVLVLLGELAELAPG